MADWHALTIEQVISTLETTESGLSDEEAARRRARLGPNTISDLHVIEPWRILARQFVSPVILLLVAAAFVSGLLGEALDSAIILGIVVINGFVGFFQEYSAERSIAALRKMTAPRARTLRSGSPQNIPAEMIVPGDIVELEAGDIVPADSLIVTAHSLRLVESSLTGESQPVQKSVGLLSPLTPLAERSNMLFMGTTVVNGAARAVIVSTGMETEFGRIARLLASQQSADDSTPLQRRLEALGRQLVWISLAIVTLLFFVGLAHRLPLIEVFLTSVSLAVAAVPEGLPAVITLALGLGVLRMSRRRALVRKLPAVETLGSVNVICTDKTGTLTTGEMTVRCGWILDSWIEFPGTGYDPNGSAPYDNTEGAVVKMFAAALIGCNSAALRERDGMWEAVGDPTEAALLSAARKLQTGYRSPGDIGTKVTEFPFDSDRKRKSVVYRQPDGTQLLLVNGAPDLLIHRCTRILTAAGVRGLSDEDRKVILARNEELASKALRVLASAYRDIQQSESVGGEADQIETGLVFVGLSGMYDPPRPEVREAVAKCQAAGIRVVMITGDHARTALAIATELGIAAASDRAMSGAELDQLNDEELLRQAPMVAVYARVSAEHKLRIIKAWKANNAIVAMTGDGVNDAPALRGADVGVAMGRAGTEVTKQAADVVIADDNFVTILAAVEEGRGIYQNITKTLQFLLSGNFGELLVVGTCAILGYPAPLLPIHLLWINLVTDGLPALCLATDPIDSTLMQQPPRPARQSILNKDFVKTLLMTGGLTALVSLAAFFYGLAQNNLELARTYAFGTLVFAELARSLGVRSQQRTMFEVGIFSNLALIVVVTISVMFQLLSHHLEGLASLLKTAPVPLKDCALLFLLGLIPAAVVELAKLFSNRSATRIA